jgi:ABC-2 type transport system permease protein
MSTASLTATLFRKDWRELIRDRRLLIAALIVIAFALLAVATSAVRVTAHEADRVATEARDRQTWEAQGERNPHGVAHFATWALRPLTPGALLDPGVTPYAGAAIWMEAHNQNPARARPIEDSVSSGALGTFSLAWVLQLLAPLLIAVIAAGWVARERERGTLRLLVASGQSATRLVSAKYRSLLAVTGLILVPLLLIGVGAAFMAGPASIAALALWLVSYGVFLAIVAAIAVAISARARSTSQAMLLLVGLWLFACVMVPRAGAGFAEITHPTPAPDQFWTAMSEAMDNAPDVFGDGADAFKAAMAARYGVATAEELPVNIDGLMLEESERQGNIVFDRFYGDLAAIYEAQRQNMRWANLFSPLPALQNISMALSGTDKAHQLAFQTQAERHRRALVTQLNTDLIENAGAEGFNYRASASLWRMTEDFRFVPPTLPATLRSIMPDALILLAWLLGALVLLRPAARRLKREVL